MESNAWSRMSIAKATADIVSRNGASMLSNSERFLSCVMDLVDNETPEMQVLVRNCDDELLGHLRGAVGKRTSEAFDEAAHRMVLLMRDERGIETQLASDLAWELVMGTAQAVGAQGVVRRPTSQSSSRSSYHATPVDSSSMGTVVVDSSRSAPGPSSSYAGSQPVGSQGYDRPASGFDPSASQGPSVGPSYGSYGSQGVPSQGMGPTVGYPVGAPVGAAPSQTGYQSYPASPVPAARRSQAPLVLAICAACVAGVVLVLALTGVIKAPSGGSGVEGSAQTQPVDAEDQEQQESGDESKEEQEETSSESSESSESSSTTGDTATTTQSPVSSTTTQSPTTSPTTTQTPRATSASSDYVLADSASRYYSYDECNAWDNWTLYLARNEIYARHGYIFKNQDLRDYFGQKSWYVPRYDSQDTAASMFNDYERANVKTMRGIEEGRNSIYLLPQSQR